MLDTKADEILYLLCEVDRGERNKSGEAGGGGQCQMVNSMLGRFPSFDTRVLRLT